MNRFVFTILAAMVPVLAKGQALPQKEILLPRYEGGDTATNEFSYHPNGKLRLIIQTDPSAEMRAYLTFDTLGRLVERVDSAKEGRINKTLFSWITPDSATTLDSSEFSGVSQGAIRQFGVTGILGVSDSTRTYLNGGQMILRAHNKKDGQGNLVESRSTFSGTANNLPPAVYNYKNTYDAQGRLVRIVVTRQGNPIDSIVSVFLYGDESLRAKFKTRENGATPFFRTFGRGFSTPRVDGRIFKRPFFPSPL